jgi:nitrogen fixation-related uncharacterized protein
VSQQTLLLLWVTFAVLALMGVAAALVWAVRTRQFSDQEKAARLPLESEITNDEEGDEADDEYDDRGEHEDRPAPQEPHTRNETASE